MSYSDNKLYFYENNIDLVLTTDHFYVDNRPMNTRHLKVHKGVNNELIFTIRNRDRKLQNLSTDTVKAYIVDPSTRAQVVTRLLENTLDIGKMKLTIAEGDIQNLKPGLYEMFLTRSALESVDTPLYTDQNNNIKFNIEITDQASVTPIETQIENTFLQTSGISVGDSANVFVTNALLGNLERNFNDATHTLALYLDSFTGNIQIQASCITAVPATEDQSTDWFTVNEITINDANTTIYPTSFTANCNWVRIVSLPITGSISQVLLRN